MTYLQFREQWREVGCKQILFFKEFVDSKMV